MSDTATILTAFRDELVTAALVRKASVAGALPPAHVEPIEGAPAPGDRRAPEDHATLVLSLFHDGDLAEDPFDAYRRRTIIDVRYRAKNTAGLKAAAALDASIRARLTEQARNYGNGFVMGGTVLVLSAGVWGGFGPIARSKAGGYVNGAKYMIEAVA